MESLSINTRDGEFVASYSELGLARLEFPNRSEAKDISKSASSALVQEWHAITAQALRDVLDGRMPKSLPPMDLSSGTDFQRSVWKAMQKIRTGETMSYGEIAAALGNPKAVRAVGGACGANPIPVLIPCHRVLAAGQKLGGFSGGLEWKRLLLQRERAQLTINFSS